LWWNFHANASFHDNKIYGVLAQLRSEEKALISSGTEISYLMVSPRYRVWIIQLRKPEQTEMGLLYLSVGVTCDRVPENYSLSGIP
jgi:hypothetical protein